MYALYTPPPLSSAGSIFHVLVSTHLHNLEHALLYSIGVNLPAHRVGQLDRVLVLASPVNDINICAWDLNRVTRFIELDVGVRMELCAPCMRWQNTMVTFIMEKRFVRECMNFLCREAKISEQPSEENGLLMYAVPHQCGHVVPVGPDPPPYSEEQELTKPSVSSPKSVRSKAHESPPTMRSTQCEQSIHPPSATSASVRAEMAFSFTDRDFSYEDCSSRSGSSGITFQGSVEVRSNGMESSSESDDELNLPPRNINRKNYECSIPANAQPYINFQPHLLNGGKGGSIEAPYQISSRIIITDKGEVQYERNILGSTPQTHGAFHFMRDMPLPPRWSSKGNKSERSSTDNCFVPLPTHGSNSCLASSLPSSTSLGELQHTEAAASTLTRSISAEQLDVPSVSHSAGSSKQAPQVPRVDSGYVIWMDETSFLPGAQVKAGDGQVRESKAPGAAKSLDGKRRRSKSEVWTSLTQDDYDDIIQIRFHRNHADSATSSGNAVSASPHSQRRPLAQSLSSTQRCSPLRPTPPSHNLSAPHTLPPSSPGSPAPRVPRQKPPVTPRRGIKRTESDDTNSSRPAATQASLDSSWPTVPLSKTLPRNPGLPASNRTFTLPRSDAQSKPVPKPRTKTLSSSSSTDSGVDSRLQQEVCVVVSSSPSSSPRTHDKACKCKKLPYSHLPPGVGESEML